MFDWEELKKDVNVRLNNLEMLAQDIRSDMEKRIEEAKNNELREALNKVTARLTAIETRLTNIEGDQANAT